MRIIHLSTRSVTYSDHGMRYVARLHDRYLGKEEQHQTKERVSRHSCPNNNLVRYQCLI